jgi:hypothetical protein
VKTNPVLRLFGPFHHLVQNVGNGFDLVIVQLNGIRQAGKLFDQFAWSGHQTAEPDEDPHDFDVDSNGRRRP